MSDTLQGNAANSQDAKHGRSSARRLMLISVIMLGFALLSWGPVLFSRSRGAIFIPAWLTMTVAAVVISMWFAKYLLTAEKNRDSETVAPVPSH